ncbi:MAG TPA: hypothetical protein VFQ13_17710 [Anaerolineales bacterium]|nr:hypothetical protein [Anaerolineales bacterium]
MIKHKYFPVSLTVLALLFGLGSSAWMGDIAPAKSPQALTTVLHEDFEDDALGTLGAPWTISSSGTGTANIANTTDHGHVLQLQGSKTEGHFLIGSLPFSSSSTDIIVQVDVKPGSGASFIWSLHGAGTSIGRRRIRLQLAPGSTTLAAQTVPSGTTNCGTLSPDTWSKVTLIVHTASRKFDVLINDASTSCTDIAAGIQPPFKHVSVMDASNTGWGGTVRFDNIDIATP